jgi:hypothetical protein
MASPTTQLLRPDDLVDPGKSDLPARDREALRAVNAWLDDFITKPHADLGRSGTVCPFVPGSLERRTLWLTAEHIADSDAAGVADLMQRYRRLLLDTAPPGTDDAMYSTIIVVFPDLHAERAGQVFGDALGQIGEAAFEEDGIIFGPFFEGNEGTAIHNSDFRPFQSPVPFIFVRYTVFSDWKFFIDDDAALDRWARHFGPAGTAVLARELRRMPWRANPE